jgi:hypothetical protein
LDFFLARSAFFFAAFFSVGVGAGSSDVEVAGDEAVPEALEDPSSLSLGRRRLVMVGIEVVVGKHVFGAWRLCCRRCETGLEMTDLIADYRLDRIR